LVGVVVVVTNAAEVQVLEVTELPPGLQVAGQALRVH
jgi:hypothetical protein